MSCSRDTDGDGNCGQRFCPECGNDGPVRNILKKPLGDMPNPTDEDLKSPEFNAIWNVIRSWDVNVPESYSGYCGANGSHVKLILMALEEANAKR
jgi:hypothetical protein